MSFWKKKPHKTNRRERVMEATEDLPENIGLGSPDNPYFLTPCAEKEYR